jgi:uncharacterized protein (DUF924 family)
MATKTAQQVLEFWFKSTTRPNWFARSLEFDELLKREFLPTLESAAKCELAEWRKTPTGRLAEIIVLDQFSRNIYRNSPASFSQDPLALGLAQEAFQNGHDKELEDPLHKMFLAMPFMHSESPKVHEEAVTIFTNIGIPMTLEFEYKHKVIIDRFGRYPHRNEILGRDSTDEELAFLQGSDSSF